MLLSGIVFDFYIPVIIFIKIVDGLFHLLLNPVPLPGAFDPVAAYQEQKLFQKEGEQILIGRTEHLKFPYHLEKQVPVFGKNTGIQNLILCKSGGIQ